MRTRNQHDPALLPQPRMRLPSQAHPDELWIAPAACGVHASHGHTCVVALHPGTQQVAAIRDFPRSFAAEWLNEHLTAIADLSCHPLCFATDWTSVPDEVRKSIPWGPWDWVRYTDGVAVDLYQEAIHEARAHTDNPHPDFVKALALARQLQADFSALEQFHQELYYMSFLYQSVKKLRFVLTSRFPRDLQTVAQLQRTRTP